MRFTDLKSKQATLVETHIKQSSLLLENACIGLTKKQKQIVEGIHTEFKPLIEASLTVDQIQGLFGNIEQTATAGGDNRTLVGKGKDTVAKVDDIINKAGKWVQDTTPVKGFDNKFEQLKTSVGKKFPELDKQLTSMGTWAKENPAKTATIIGVLTALASLAGGPVGGAIAGQVLRGTTELMKGEKLSTAVGKSAKTAAYGALAGAGLELLSDNIIGHIATAQIEELDAMEAAMKSENFLNAKADLFADLGMDVDALEGVSKLQMKGSINGFFYNYDSVIPPDMMSQYRALEAAVGGAKTFSPEHYKAAGEFHNFMAQLVRSDDAKDLTAAWDALAEIPRDEVGFNQLSKLVATADSGDVILKNMSDAGGAIAAAAQGAMQTVDNNAKNAHKSKPITPEEKEQLESDPKQESYSLSETDLRRLWVGVSMMSETSRTNEGPKDALKFVGDKAKQAAGAVASKVADVGKNLTTKVTASKLATAWEKAGKPTEDIAVHEFLVSQGIEASTVDNAFKSAKLKVPQVPNVKVAELTKSIKGLTQEQFAQLKQQIIDKYNKLQGQPA
tara:strand:- start:857 stop:2539 length:1683 start_codon:yes stop_codon:yes gene_type:complete